MIRVGKRGGCRSTPQDFICRLMRRYALQGLRVVRVKGGDALLFGRAGEEISFLRRAGVGVQIINGVSAAFAAASALEVSLTHRSHCHGITFVTAHTHDHGEPNWGALAASGATLGIYMGLRRADALATALLAHLPASTPAAIVQAATRPEQQRRLTTLGEPGTHRRRHAAGLADLAAGGRCLVRGGSPLRRSLRYGAGAGGGVSAICLAPCAPITRGLVVKLQWITRRASTRRACRNAMRS